jgi:hypothetical protein
MKFWDIVVCVTAVFLVTATATPQTAQTTATRDDNGDSYAVYSALIPKELGDSTFQRYAIAQHTVTEGWQIAAIAGRAGKRVRDCIAVPTDEAREYETAIADFQQKNSSSERLELRLKLEKPYLLLNDADEASYRRRLAATWGFAPKDYQPDQRFDGGSALISASRVGFSDDGNVAIVYVQHECGSLCDGGSLHVLRKQGDKWVEEKLVTCAWQS